MRVRVLPEARDDLRELIRHYRAIKPPALGKKLAARVLDAFRTAVANVVHMPLALPEHPDIPGARWVLLDRFPYIIFFALTDEDLVIVAVEFATRDYADRVMERVRGSRG